MKKDRQSLVKAVMYLIRDVFFYTELEKIKEFIEEIMAEKEECGYDNDWLYNKWCTNQPIFFNKYFMDGYSYKSSNDFNKGLA